MALELDFSIKSLKEFLTFTKEVILNLTNGNISELS